MYQKSLWVLWMIQNPTHGCMVIRALNRKWNKDGKQGAEVGKEGSGLMSETPGKVLMRN